MSAVVPPVGRSARGALRGVLLLVAVGAGLGLIATECVAFVENADIPGRSLADLEGQYQSWIESEPIRFGFENYPDQQLSYAFVLARLGARDEAETWFREFSSCSGTTPDGIEKVRRIFDELLAQTGQTQAFG